ncbi:MAG TPA: M14 family metallopeptidase [Cyclobacteriaceae bacterium]|nr:M14 family metallopeptidase [Cyclobacteriaceae bacterium]
MRILSTVILLFSFLSVFAQQSWPEDLITTPEKTNYIKTSTHADVMDFVKAIQSKSENAFLFSMGTSKEGKEIPVVVLSKDKIKTAAEVKTSGKLVVYIQGNIHAGEVEGKEVLMLLMREILLGDKKHLLDNQIILFAPIYNTDSNDKMEKGRRPSQEDSPLEVGLRENSQGLDLNRDGMKMEAIETQSLFANVLLPWDPHVFVDLHTTNGTWHGYSLTWAPGYQSSGHPATYEFVNNKMLPEITSVVKSKYDLNFGPFGDYYLREGWPPKNFYTYNHHPRYLVNQFGLRNRLSILSEAFAHERFYQRIHSTYRFVSEILEYTNTHTSQIMEITKRADAETVAQMQNGGGSLKKGVRFKMAPLKKLNSFLTYDYIQKQKTDGTIENVRSGKISQYNDVTYHARFEPTLEATVPSGYIIPARFSKIADNLRMHGIKVDPLSKSATFQGEVFQIKKFEKAKQVFQGHAMAQADGQFVSATKRFLKGDFVVEMNQPLANLIFYLLEPQSDDGLLTWNFLDEYIETNKGENKPVEYPVFKYTIKNK